MATPNVVNLAAKLFALDPALTPAEAIELPQPPQEEEAE